MKAILLKNVKLGDCFTLRPVECVLNDSLVYVRGEYVRELKKYEVSKFVDITDSRFMRGDRIVYIDFIF